MYKGRQRFNNILKFFNGISEISVQVILWLFFFLNVCFFTPNLMAFSKFGTRAYFSKYKKKHRE